MEIGPVRPHTLCDKLAHGTAPAPPSAPGRHSRIAAISTCAAAPALGGASASRKDPPAGAFPPMPGGSGRDGAPFPQPVYAKIMKPTIASSRYDRLVRGRHTNFYKNSGYEAAG